MGELVILALGLFLGSLIGIGTPDRLKAGVALALGWGVNLLLFAGAFLER
jgi:hypothetical protein